jgi:OmpA-OmpF porin, OOP family
MRTLERFYLHRFCLPALLCALAFSSSALGQSTAPRGTQQQEASTAIVRMAANGEKVKVKGRIASRTGDTLNVRDQRGNESVILLTDRTSVKSKGGFFKRGTNYDVTSLLRGLPIEIEGRGNSEGQVVAEKIRFNNSDMRVAETVDTRVVPVEMANQRLSGQVDELHSIAANTSERISALDNFDVDSSATVYFPVNRSTLTPESKRQLDELARKAVTLKGYVIEVAGHADSSGNEEYNRILSQRRADAVVSYLRENHDIPLRRMVTPAGYGEAKSVADNTTSSGRQQNRRVEVKVLVSQGINRPEQSRTQAE